MNGIEAQAEIDIEAPPEQVWSALTEPDEIEKYMFGTRVHTDWKPGSPITWQGEYEGKQYENKGEVLEHDAPWRLTVTHFSPLSGQPDAPENYHTVSYDLTRREQYTHLRLTQDNNASLEEAEHSAHTWSSMLEGLKESVEGASA